MFETAVTSILSKRVAAPTRRAAKGRGGVGVGVVKPMHSRTPPPFVLMFCGVYWLSGTSHNALQPVNQIISRLGRPWKKLACRAGIFTRLRA